MGPCPQTYAGASLTCNDSYTLRIANVVRYLECLDRIAVYRRMLPNAGSEHAAMPLLVFIGALIVSYDPPRRRGVPRASSGCDATALA